jgi:hypothetical protein
MKTRALVWIVVVGIVSTVIGNLISDRLRI